MNNNYFISPHYIQVFPLKKSGVFNGAFNWKVTHTHSIDFSCIFLLWSTILFLSYYKCPPIKKNIKFTENSIKKKTRWKEIRKKIEHFPFSTSLKTRPSYNNNHILMKRKTIGIHQLRISLIFRHRQNIPHGQIFFKIHENFVSFLSTKSIRNKNQKKNKKKKKIYRRIMKIYSFPIPFWCKQNIHSSKRNTEMFYIFTNIRPSHIVPWHSKWFNYFYSQFQKEK